MLGCAALEGPTFTAQAIARALGHDTDTVLDLLDDYLLDSDDQPGLIAEVGFVPFDDRLPANYPNLYRFAYPHLWHIWHTYGLPAARRTSYQLRLANALEQVYALHTDRIAGQLLALFTAAGHLDRAEPYRRHTGRSADLVVILWQIDLLQRHPGTHFDDLRLFELRLDASGKLRDVAHYAEGANHAHAALAMAQSWSDLPREARAANHLGINLHAQGVSNEAQKLHEHALAIRERVMGTNHPDTANSLNSLASLLYAQGMFADAQPLLERALAICEQVRGASHPETVICLNNLATLLRAQGSFAKARPLLERALTICEQVLGTNHPYMATSLNNLATLLHSQGESTEAQLLLERALAIRETMLGAAHPDTAWSLNNLAGLLGSQGAFADAKPLLERALAIREQVLGADHPLTQHARANLAALDAQMQKQEQ